MTKGAMQISRRAFIKDTAGAAGLVAFGSSIPAFLVRSSAAMEGGQSSPGTVLVVIQLSGGNDGLSTVVPYQDDAYCRSRPTLRIAPGQVLKLDGGLGLHPAMPAFGKLYQEGRLSIIQGVGYPKSSRDHDLAMEDWHTGVLRDQVPPGARTGWLGRAIDSSCNPSKTDLRGVFVGEIKAPFSLRTERVVVPDIKSLEEWLPTGSGWDDSSPPRVSGPSSAAAGSSLLASVRAATANARLVRQRLTLADKALRSKTAVYPPYPLAQNLATIAQLIRAELGIRIFFAELGGGGIGGFDSHANQAANHGALLRELAESALAFVNDLNHDRLLDSVLVMTFSEFGRTLTENGRRGTDHGTAAPIFMIGGKVKGGLWGAHPSLTDLEADSPKYHTDFRRVYATVLGRWLNLEYQKVLRPGFAPLDGVLV
jgi:uncharacterized protein (DUF1501 family)